MTRFKQALKMIEEKHSELKTKAGEIDDFLTRTQGEQKDERAGFLEIDDKTNTLLTSVGRNMSRVIAFMSMVLDTAGYKPKEDNK